MADDIKKYPVFRHVSGQVIPGIGLRKFAYIFIIAILGTILFITLGYPQKIVDEPISEFDQSDIYKHYELVRNTVYSAELRANGLGAIDDEQTGAQYTYSNGYYESAYLQEAYELNINTRTTNDELLAKVPKTKEVSIEVFPGLWRAIVFFFIPIGLFVGLNVEIEQGSTIMKDFLRFIRSRKTQKVYRYKNRFSQDYSESEVIVNGSR